MTFPVINPSAFNHEGCSCGHCFCDCNDCTGGRDWIKVGDSLLSDRAIMLPATVLDPAPTPVHSVAMPPYLKAFLTADYSDQPSGEWFNPSYLDVLEALGYRVRPLASDHRVGNGSGRTHGVLHDGTVVGLLMPIDNPVESARKAV